MLRPTDFQSKALPSRSAVKNRFGMTLKEFLDTYYPLPEGPQLPEEAIRSFREEYLRCGATSMESYNRRRAKGSPCAVTVIRRSGAGSWLELLSRAGLHKKRPPRRGAEGYEVTMHFVYEDRLREWEERWGL